jgi:hypothetical protein
MHEDPLLERSPFAPLRGSRLLFLRQSGYLALREIRDFAILRSLGGCLFGEEIYLTESYSESAFSNLRLCPIQLLDSKTAAQDISTMSYNCARVNTNRSYG